MRIEPPLSRLYYQPLKHCAICGHGIDENGTHPGRKLTEDEKQQAWVNWLARNGLTPEIIHNHYRLSQQDFFANQTTHTACGELTMTKIQP
ncbi:MAG: hypothetical protein OHK0052_00040 [Anaerolineales bacterium]